MGILIFILLFAGSVLFLAYLAKIVQIPRNWLWIIWAGKTAYSFLFVFLFSNYYGSGEALQGDSYKFYEDGRILNQLAYEDPKTFLKILVGISGDEESLLKGPLKNTVIWDNGDNGDFMNDNRLIIRLNSLIHFISFENEYVHVLFFSLIGFLGLILTYKAFEEFIANKKLFFFVICLIPSVGFWGSGLAKETIMIFGLGLLFWVEMKILKQKLTVKTFLIWCAAAFLCLANKPYAGLVILPLLCLLHLGKMIQWKKYGLLLASSGIILTAVILCFTPERINLIDKVSAKQRDMINLAKGGVFFITDSSFCAFDYKWFDHFDTPGTSKIAVTRETAGEYKLFGESEFHPFTIQPSDSLYDVYLITPPSASYFDTRPIDYKGSNLLLAIPEVLFNTLVRPFPTDNGSNLKYISFMQNTGLILFALFVLLNRKRLSDFETYWLYVLLTSAFILLLVIGWTTPVFGAIARYKVPVDLCILICLFILSKPFKILKQ